jgi:hypothetical protein
MNKAKNKAKGIQGSLARKLGPLPIWLWAIVGFGLVWYYRNKLSAGSTSGTGTGSVAPAAATPQAQTTLQPGESVYDPNTGALTTAPGAVPGTTTTADTGIGSNGAATATDYSQGITDLANAIVGSIDSMGNQGTGTTGGQAAASGRQPASQSPPRLASGGVRAPFGARRPPARAGYTIRGQGRGFWEYVPVIGNKRKPKPKAQHGTPARTTKPTPVNAKRKPRSTAKVRQKNAGRTVGPKTSSRTVGHPRGGAKPVATQARTMSARRGKPIVTSGTVRQRPVATATPRKSTPQPSVHRPVPARTASRTRTTRKR